MVIVFEILLLNPPYRGLCVIGSCSLWWVGQGCLFGIISVWNIKVIVREILLLNPPYRGLCVIGGFVKDAGWG